MTPGCGPPTAGTTACAEACKAAKGGQVEYRVEKAGIVHAGVGKASFTETAIAENIRAVIDAVVKAKPAGAKGTIVQILGSGSKCGHGVIRSCSESHAPAASSRA